MSIQLRVTAAGRFRKRLTEIKRRVIRSQGPINASELEFLQGYSEGRHGFPWLKPGYADPRDWLFEMVRPFSSVVFRVEATVFLKFLENLPSLAVGHKSGEYLAQHVFFCGRLVREEGHLLKLHPAMNGFQPNLERIILLLSIEIFSVIPEEKVSLIFWVIRHLDAFYSSELPWLSGRNQKDNSNFAAAVGQKSNVATNSSGTGCGSICSA
jgi:hypothetical protein